MISPYISPFALLFPGISKIFFDRKPEFMFVKFITVLTYLYCFTMQAGYGQDSGFVTRAGHQFRLHNSAYNFIGANYWYAGLLGLTAAGKERLINELDFLAGNEVTNLRILAVAEGEGLISGVPRVEPAFQPQKKIYNVDLLKGLDFLLAEMGKRKMKAVIYLANNWEWSGGFLQYLNWNDLLPDSIMRRKLSWDEQRNYTSLFYSCAACTEQQAGVLKMIVGRTNSITHKKYIDDTAIMSWELANEPRPMRPAAVPAYKKWIAETAALIKSIDSNHLVTAGAEGDIGTEGMENFQLIHADKNIDYATIHIWPKNWGWFKDSSIAVSMDSIGLNTKRFIGRHVMAMQKINKPLVIEEFGLPRDNLSFYPAAPTHSRDTYYSSVFDELTQSVAKAGVINGVNFWAFGGLGRPSHKQLLWAKDEDMLGDPPVEEQGLNSVFDTDTSTWSLIRSYIRKIKK